MNDPVIAQYEALPYPARDPRDEAKRLVTGSPSHLDEVNHYVFGGRLDVARPLRVLVAGGGTGDATVMLAQQMADRGVPGEIVHLDLSAASRRVAAARVAARGLDNVRFVAGSLLEVADLAPGPFDYVDCCGVLHHLEDPGAGLAALVSVLAPHGGLGLMVYGAVGRQGVYETQDLLRLLAPVDRPPEERLAVAKRLLPGLPVTSPLRRNPFVRDHVGGGDAGLYDLLLHPRDRAYRVPDVSALCAGAGLDLLAFIEPCMYEPATYLGDP
ncbi:MAG: class I SAM-dependent methyltransferase, partial [Alphaproteobacteria bacterium]